MRPLLSPGLRRLWRDPHTVQLGTDPTRAVILDFREPAATRLLELLDGTRTEPEVLHEAAARLGLDAAATTEILDQLTANGLLTDVTTLLPAGLPEQARRRLLVEAAALVADGRRRTTRSGAGQDPRALGLDTGGTPAEALRRRSAAKVLVTGPEALVTPIVIALAAAGVGHVAPIVDGAPPSPELLGALSQAAPEIVVTPLRVGTATVIVRIGPKAPPVPTGKGRRAAMLDVTMRDGMILVGPMVLPYGSPCGRCLDLHRRDRDPAWPVLASQLATEASPADCCPLTTLLSGAALTAEEVLGLVDGRSFRTQGAAFEVRRPGETRRRSWSAHPRCDCRRRRLGCDGG